MHDELFEHVLFGANLVALEDRRGGDAAGDFAIEVTEDGQALVEGESRQDSFARRAAHEIAQTDVVQENQAGVGHAAGEQLAGLEPPRFEDTESTLDELRARIRRTLEAIAKIDAKTIDAGAEREVAIPIGGGRKAMTTGGNYLTHFALPNFYFHLVTAYDILRYAGVPIGKRDYLGEPPSVTIV